MNPMDLGFHLPGSPHYIPMSIYFLYHFSQLFFRLEGIKLWRYLQTDLLTSSSRREKVRDAKPW